MSAWKRKQKLFYRSTTQRHITPYGQKPIAIDPLKLAERLELSVRTQRIRENASVFGQIYFVDTDTEMFDAIKGETVPVHIPGPTIVVNPKMYLLRNLGSGNNTIVHECIHWVKHRKVFELEKLYNADAPNISCEVVGGVATKNIKYCCVKLKDISRHAITGAKRQIVVT